MNTPTTRLNHRRPGLPDLKPLRFRAELPAVSTPAGALRTMTAIHDFLVANPRPDLTMDSQTLRMIEPNSAVKLTTNEH